MTRRRSSYRSLRSLERDLRVCRACVEAGHPLESLPVIAPLDDQRAYLYGQAPGIQEGLERRPWRGRAGRTLRGWLNAPANRKRVEHAAALVHEELGRLQDGA